MRTPLAYVSHRLQEHSAELSSLTRSTPFPCTLPYVPTRVSWDYFIEATCTQKLILACATEKIQTQTGFWCRKLRGHVIIPNTKAEVAPYQWVQIPNKTKVRLAHKSLVCHFPVPSTAPRMLYLCHMSLEAVQFAACSGINTWNCLNFFLWRGRGLSCNWWRSGITAGRLGGPYGMPGSNSVRPRSAACKAYTLLLQYHTSPQHCLDFYIYLFIYYL